MGNGINTGASESREKGNQISNATVSYLISTEWKNIKFQESVPNDVAELAASRTCRSPPLSLVKGKEAANPFPLLVILALDMNF